MSVRIDLQAFSSYGVPASLEVEGKSVGECLEMLIRRFPQMAKILFDEQGKLIGYVEIFVNGVAFYPHNLTYQVKEGDVIMALAVIGGG
jgi:molybdopterin converting factor small subunit